MAANPPAACAADGETRPMSPGRRRPPQKL